jgi:hypothetical protein
MTIANINVEEGVGSVTGQLLRYASQQGIHMFRPEDSNKNLTIVNRDQGIITLVFTDSGGISHRNISKRIWNFELVRRFYARWLTCQ